MKIARVIFTVALVLLCGVGWYTQISNITSGKVQLESGTEDGAAYMERGLYQKAMQSYQSALAIREDSGLRDELLKACEAAWLEGLITRSAYQSSLREACTVYPERADYWARLVELACSVNSYREANTLLYRAEQAGAESDRLSQLRNEVRYSYTVSWQTYDEICRAPGGYATVFDGRGWGVIAPDGDREYACEYQYITPYSDDRSAVFCTEESVRLFDASKVVQAILPETPAPARACGDGLMPVFREEQWSYLDCESGDYLPECYEDASTFQNGIAAVKQTGKWALIDTNGEAVCEQAFTDIKLHGNGDYCFDGLMAAAVGGVWSLYTPDGEAAVELQAADLDVYLGGYIAFQSPSGLWGFVDKSGKVVIEPEFQQARSFSGGLAAVYDGAAWGFIDPAGTLVIPCGFLDVSYFSNQGCCFVSEVDGQFYSIKLRFPPLS